MRTRRTFPHPGLPPRAPRVWLRSPRFSPLGAKHGRELRMAVSGYPRYASVHRAGGEVPGMAGPGDEIAAAAGGRGRPRASHADREQVIEVLKAAFVQGRLDRDEFDLRVGLPLASRTYADLTALTADITPARLTRARPLGPARKSANKKKKAVAALACTTLAYPGLMAALPPIPDGSPFAVPVLVIMFVLPGALATGWLLLLHAWLDKRAGRQPAHGLPPGGGGEACRNLAPAARPDSSRRSIAIRGKRPRLRRSAAPARHCPAGGRRIEGAPRAQVHDRLPRLLARPRRGLRDLASRT